MKTEETHAGKQYISGLISIRMDQRTNHSAMPVTPPLRVSNFLEVTFRSNFPEQL